MGPSIGWLRPPRPRLLRPRRRQCHLDRRIPRGRDAQPRTLPRRKAASQRRAGEGSHRGTRSEPARRGRRRSGEGDHKRRRRHDRGHDQKTLEEAGHSSEGFGLFCFGGSGANFAAGAAGRPGLSGAYVFETGPVLSALGSSVSDISHVHEEWPFLSLSDGAGDEVWKLVEAGRDRVIRDLEGEGLTVSGATLSAEVTVANGRSRSLAFDVEESRGKAAISSEAGTVERVAVRGVSPVPRIELDPRSGDKYDAHTSKGRKVFGEGAGIYDWDDLSARGTATRSKPRVSSEEDEPPEDPDALADAVTPV